MKAITLRLRSLALAVAAAALSACATLAPDYQRPAAPVPEHWPQRPGLSTPADAPAADTLSWRDYFADPRLRAVIGQALENNRDLRVALLDIEQARARYRIQRAERLPAVSGQAGMSAQRLPGDLRSGGEAGISRQYSASVGLSSWELDLFGRIRSLQDQALETYLATEEASRSAQISLVAEVADAWFTLASDRALLALARRTFDTQQRSYDITRRSLDLGVASRLELSQLETTLQRARADVARLVAQVDSDRNALELLAGAPLAEALLPEALDDAAATLAELPAGLPSEVLVRRPDVQQAERALRAANASIGAARAAFFPSISLTASAGTASASLDGLFEAGARSWSFVPQVSVPIFNAGALQASLDVAEIQRDIGVANYEKAIQSAFREVADALARRATIDEQLDASQRLADAARQAFRLADARYDSGVDSALTQLDAQRTLYAAEQEVIATRLAETANRVALYKVLGGGWQ